MTTGVIKDYWNKTETYEALAEYIRKDYDGLKEAVALLMDGGRLVIDTSTYENDMTTFTGRDDVLSLLIWVISALTMNEARSSYPTVRSWMNLRPPRRARSGSARSNLLRLLRNFWKPHGTAMKKRWRNWSRMRIIRPETRPTTMKLL
jgi:hypothetical protein